MGRVLIIDDSEAIHALLDVRLRDESLELIHALDPRRGLELARAHSPDVILLDVDMPDQDGFEVLESLRGYPETKLVPVLFLTGAMDTETKVRGLELGAMDYITKPFEVAELKARVRAALRVKALQDELLAFGRIDPLTGLWNRRYFDSRLAQEVSEALRTQRALGLLMIDADHFKRINDTHGHPAGDAVLQQLGAWTTHAVRATDVVCRYGGEELAVLLPGADRNPGLTVAERVLHAVRNGTVRHEGIELRVTVSIGLAWLDSWNVLDPKACATTLLRHADRALYDAKRAGRDRVVDFAAEPS
ncbi:MAG: diguanylate cyclase [Sandaracinus sp.]|nr:diguanylate cyclase [Sandaracinus sp.]MCB9631038.1 diguanylate cyclase [Sandaracinus sp.]